MVRKLHIITKYLAVIKALNSQSYTAKQNSSIFIKQYTSVLYRITHYIQYFLAQIQFEASGSTSGSNLTISLNATVDGEYECSLDGGSYQACM